MKNVLILGLLFLVGCGLTYKQVPLTSGNTPYVLPPGQYIDIQGCIHEETNNRWSLSEEDLFKNSAPDFIDTPKIEHPKKENNIFIISFILVCCLIVIFGIIKRLRNLNMFKSKPTKKRSKALKRKKRS